jgi:hypothetical protein
MTEKLYTNLQQEIYIPSEIDRKNQGKYLRKFQVVMVVDGTEQPVVASLEKKKTILTYSGKQKEHTFTKLIGVGLSGRIWFISTSYAGMFFFFKIICEGI